MIVTTPVAPHRWPGTCGRWRALLVGAAIVLAVRTGSADTGAGRVFEPAAGSTVRAGEVVRVRWTPVAQAVEEFELLLSLDGGRTFPLRLTEMLDPRLTAFAWRVPNLPSGSVCLRLRVGVDEHEILLPPGPEFALAGDAGVPTERVTFWRGEWWPTEGVASTPPDVASNPCRADRAPNPEVVVCAVAPQHHDRSAGEGIAGGTSRGAPPPLGVPALAVDARGAGRSFPKRE